MSRSIRRIVAALSVAVFVAQAGDGVMAAICPPEDHYDLHAGEAAPGSLGLSAMDGECPDLDEDGVGGAKAHSDYDSQAGSHDSHEHGDEGHCCPFAFATASACAGVAATVEQGAERVTPPAPHSSSPAINDDLPPDPFLSGTFRPPRA